jgi:methylaspartate mutase sigma subunit
MRQFILVEKEVFSLAQTLITGVIGDDVHTIGSKILEYALRKAGYNVVYLGVCVSADEFIKAAIETNAKAILITSVYGHGELDCRDFRARAIEAGLENILLYVGGQLVIGKQEWSDVESKFKDFGFDRVAPPRTTPDTVLRWLEEDLG